MTEPAGGLVSIVIPVYNRPEGLRDAVESSLGQDYRPIEVIIVDDGSTDATPQVAADLAAASPALITVLRQPNAGPGAARERGRATVRGEFVQYLDSDDVLLPGKLRAQVAALRHAPSADVAYGWTRFRHADGSVHPQPWKGSGVLRQTMFPDMLVDRWWDTPNPLYRRSVVDRAGAWLPLWQEEDWEYDCRVGAGGARLAYVEMYVCEVRDHASARLSRSGRSVRSLRNRAAAQLQIHALALGSSLARDDPAFATFARRLFLLARQCGAASLAAESKALFEAARSASTPQRRAHIDFVAYAALARVLGWTWLGRASCWLDRLRSPLARA